MNTHNNTRTGIVVNGVPFGEAERLEKEACDRIDERKAREKLLRDAEAERQRVEAAMGGGSTVDSSAGVGSLPVRTPRVPLVRLGKLFTVSVSGFPDVDCSRSSTSDFDSLQSFDYCKRKGLEFQSVGSAVLVRKFLYDQSNNKKSRLDHSNEYQKSSTVSLKYRDGSDIAVVFAELDMSVESRDLLEKGVRVHNAGGELFLPSTDSLIDRLLKSGRRTAPLEISPLKLSTEQQGNSSEYSNNPYNIALLGSQQLAEVNASYLRARGKTEGHTYDFTRKDLEERLEGKDGQVLVRPCSLGGGDYDVIVDVGAGDDFNNGGCARGFTCVGQKKFSTGNRGAV